MTLEHYPIMMKVKGSITRASASLSFFRVNEAIGVERKVKRGASSTLGSNPGDAKRHIPNFLIIGAGKAGTTSLWHQLSQHPQIFMHASKKLNYFAFEGDKAEFRGPPPIQSEHYAVRIWDDYIREFDSVRSEIAIGEACNSYLYGPTAARRIRESIPDARIIAVLRHPGERGHSRYLQLRGSGRETITKFEDALLAEDGRFAENWWPDFYYLRGGFYFEQLRRYFDVFPASQIRVYLHDDMLKAPFPMLRDIFSFLGVSEEFVPDIGTRYNPTGIPKNKGVDWVLRTLKQAKPAAQRMLSRSQMEYFLRLGVNVHTHNLFKPKLSPEARAWMIQRYRDDTLRLQDMLGRDLSPWLI